MQIITPSAGTVIEGDSVLAALKVSPHWPEGDAYALSARTGLMATPTGGGGQPVFLLHLVSALPRVAIIDYLRVRGLFTTPPTTAQEWGLSARLYYQPITASYGTNSVLPTAVPTNRKQGSYGQSSMLYQVATLGVMSGLSGIPGTSTIIHTSEFLNDQAWELAAGVAVPRSKIEMIYDNAEGTASPLLLREGEGVMVENAITVGAGGVLRVNVDVEWREFDLTEI